MRKKLAVTLSISEVACGRLHDGGQAAVRTLRVREPCHYEGREEANSFVKFPIVSKESDVVVSVNLNEQLAAASQRRTKPRQCIKPKLLPL